MARYLISLLILVFAFTAQASADSFELKAKKVKINKKNDGIFPEIELRPKILRDIEKVPKYKSDAPQTYSASFGSGEEVVISFAVDESKGAGKGFDTLIVDTKGNGDLKKGKKLKGKTTPSSYSFDETAFGSFELKVPVKGADLDSFHVHARFYKSKRLQESSLYLTSLCVLEGDAVIDGKKLKMVVFDANCNGVFGERGTPGGYKAAGDKIWLGEGSVSVEEACVNALPLGQYFLFEDRYYEIAFNDDNTVGIQAADLKLGRIKVNNPGFLLELVKNGEVLYVFNEKGDEVNVPTGSYKVNTSGFRKKHKGKLWTLEGTPGACKESFKVVEDKVTDLSVGPPLRVVVTADVSHRGNSAVASLNFSIAGSSGEKYKYLLCDGKKTDLPEISIRNSRNKEVEKGKFEYG